MSRFTVVVAMALLGCASKTHPASTREEPPVTMPAESRAAAAFRAYTASHLHVSPREILSDSELARNHTHGSVQAFFMEYSHDGRRCARGWAATDGTVITPKQNLGILFAEAGVWAKPLVVAPDKLANTLAEDILWSYSDSDQVEVSSRAKPPELVLAPDGSGSLRFVAKSPSFSLDFDAQFIPDESIGGGGGYSDNYFEITVVLTSDHKATLTKKPFETSKTP